MAAARATPAVSVVLPTRNRASSLHAAMRSVLDQDLDDLELIVVDDASSDGTADLVVSVGDPRVRCIRLDRPLGAAVARNRAINEARGQLVAFQDSDDMWCEGHLRLLVGSLRGDEQSVVAYGAVRRPPSEGGTIIPGPGDPVRSGDLQIALTRYNLVNLPSSLVRTSALVSIGGFDARLARYQDWDLFLTLAGLGPFCFVDVVITMAGDASRRISRDAGAEKAALTIILQKHRRLFGAVPDIEVAQRARLARLLLGDRRLGAAAVEGVRILTKPRSAARWVRSEVEGRSSLLDRDRLGVTR